MAVAQWRTNHQKVVLDLFDRRFAIYEQTRALIDRVVSAGTVTKADVDKLQDIRARAQFLFGPDIFELLSKVSKNVSALNAVSYGPARLPSVHDHAEDAQIREVLLDQFFELSAVAAPYMKMDQKRVPFAINYRRGFFRAWVMLTVLWVASVAYVSGPDVYSAFDRAAFKAAVEKDPIVERPNKDTPIDPNIPTITVRDLEPRAPWLENQPGWNPDPWGWLLRSTAVALLPPLALLALGAMLGWVVGGFRRA